MARIEIGGLQLEYELIPAHQLNRPTLVFLHEGLGCVAFWRDFPARVAQQTGCRTLVYSRRTYGQSDADPAKRTPRYLHEEALEWLPELLAALGIERPVLVGHSDGGSIALIHAGAFPDRVAGVVAMAPHEFVELAMLPSIEEAGRLWRTTDWPVRLGKYHRQPERVFREWYDTWTSDAFRSWNIEEYLPRIACPVLAIQGEDDEYATMAQIDAIAAQAPDVELLRLADCRHSPHRDQPEAVVAAIVDFLERLGRAI